MRVIFTRPADQDLAEIGAWIEGDSPRAASRTLNALVDASIKLGSFPLRYPEIPGLHLRKRPFGQYLIFYRVTDQVEIIRILHSARDWLSLLDEA
ncbi:type II toxin-antitoxin system RelE/ParE family toxin [soil metagenome]